MATTGEYAGSEQDATTLVGALLVRTRPADLLALVAVPLVLLGVFALPEATRRSLAFQYTDPTVLTAYTAHFVHLEANHLIANLFGYCLLAGTGYAVALLSRRRRFFFTAMATYLLAFPFVLSALNLAVPRHAIGYGFSGINMAFLGVLPLVMAAYARVHLYPESSVQPLPAVFFASVAWMALLALPVGLEGAAAVGGGVVAFGALVGVWYLHSAMRARGWRRAVREWTAAVTARPGYGDLFVVGIVLLIAYPVVGFPTNPVGEGRVLNLYVHLLGYCLGFIGPYALLAAGIFRD